MDIEDGIRLLYNSVFCEQKMNVLIFTPIFNPSTILKEYLDQRLSFCTDQVIYLNSPYQAPDNSKLTILANGNYNNGISKPFNEAMRFAKDNNFDYVLFLDQDTLIDLEILMSILPAYTDNTNTENTAIFFLRSEKKSIRPYGDLLTNSGSLFSVKIFDQLGGFNERYFVDCLDYDFCLRVWRQGFQIVNLPLSKYFDHMTLQDGVTKRFLSRELYIRRYSKRRHSEMSLAYKDILIDVVRNKEWTLFLKFLKSYVAFQLGKIISKVSS